MTATWERALPSATTRRIARVGPAARGARVRRPRLAVPGSARRHRQRRARRRTGRADRAGHRARLPGQPGHQLRRRRPRAGPGHARRAARRSACGWNYVLSARRSGSSPRSCSACSSRRSSSAASTSSPRLIVTVATIGIAQVLTGAALFLPQLVRRPRHLRLAPPRPRRSRCSFTLPGGHASTRPTSSPSSSCPSCFVALGLFMRRSHVRHRDPRRRPSAATAPRRSASRSSGSTRSSG